MNICTICPKRAAQIGRNAVGVVLGRSVGGLLPLIVRMVFFLLKFSRLKPPAFLLKANHLTTIQWTGKTLRKKILPEAKRGVEIFFQQTQRGSLVQPNGLFRNFGTKRLMVILCTYQSLIRDLLTLNSLKWLGAMLAKKKKKKTIIKRTTQPRTVRLNRAKAWLESYEGKNLVRGYAKKYRVDLLCAIAELRILGVEIKEEYEMAVKKTIEQQLEQKRKKKQAELSTEEFGSGELEFIAGYTDSGVPYGITTDNK